jgi:Fe-S cluster assembly ATPase SufC
MLVKLSKNFRFEIWQLPSKIYGVTLKEFLGNLTEKNSKNIKFQKNKQQKAYQQKKCKI